MASAVVEVSLIFVKLIPAIASLGDTYHSFQEIVSVPLTAVAASVNACCVGGGNAYFFGLSNRSLGYSGLVGLRLM